MSATGFFNGVAARFGVPELDRFRARDPGVLVPGAPLCETLPYQSIADRSSGIGRRACGGPVETLQRRPIG
jgi:hypothetical protein